MGRSGASRAVVLASIAVLAAGCHGRAVPGNGRVPISQPLISGIYTADPSAHVFDGKLYVFVSHDVDTGAAESPDGDQFDMRDYRVLSMDAVGAAVVDHGVALALTDIPWANRQLWAPDTAVRNGAYYLYFPAKDRDGIFRIGVAKSALPTGPYAAEARPIEGAFSIDPAVFRDDDGTYYMYFGGLSGGQLERWQHGRYEPASAAMDGDGPALGPRVARLHSGMLRFDEDAREVTIVDRECAPLRANDHARRFYEAAWMYKFKGTYYLSYSTGDTHLICYATGDNPYGPFTYRGVILQPVVGWTTHHSIAEVGGQWYLFYHDSVLSGGKTHLRNARVTPLNHNADGSIPSIDAYR